MSGITHLPMGLMWQMPVPVACSLAVAVSGLAVTCGQCPLDQAGKVQHPDDAVAQAALVGGMAQGALGHLQQPHQAALLVVYHDAEDEAALLAPLGQRFPAAVLAPIRLPHFYYPGMRIEVDVYAAAEPQRVETLTDAGGIVQISRGGPLDLVALRAPDIAVARRLLGRLDPDRLLSAQWFSAEPAPAEWHPDPETRVVPPPGAGVRGVLTLARQPVRQGQSPGGALRREAGGWVWLSAKGRSPDLARAAHEAMDALALPAQPDLTIVKATTHYVGGAGPEDLHDNLAVRHARFPQPGPASTGVPVAGLDDGSLAIGMLGVITDRSN